MFLPNNQTAGQVPKPLGSFALYSTRPYLNAYFEFNRAEVYSLVTPRSVKVSFFALTRNTPFTR